MTTILPSERSPWDVIGSQIGANLSNVLPGAVQQGFNRGQLQESLNAIQNLAKDKKASPLDITLAAMKAGAGIPGSERYLGQIIPYLANLAQANSQEKVRYPGEEEGAVQSFQGQALPQFMQKPGEQPQESKFFPSNQGSQEAPGNLPQAATTGQVQPLLTPGQRFKEARRVQKEAQAAGIPLTVEQALERVDKNEEDKRAHNKIVEEERQQRVEGQQTYGQRGVEELRKVFPEDSKFQPSSEMEAIFQKKGELQAREGKSEADINRYLANEAKLFKNAIVNVQKELSAPRLQNMIWRGLNGTYKNFEDSAADLRQHLKPLLDLGLFDTARNLLQDKGYGIEEREMILHPLNEQAKSAMNLIPDRKSIKPFQRGEIDPEEIKSRIMAFKKADPNFSLPLARKAFEDKGYDWRSFKNALNELVESGQIELEDDQRIQQGYLDSPPLNDLDKFLKGLNLIGR